MNTSELNRIKLDNNEVAQTAAAADEEEAPAPSKSPFVRSKVVATWSTELSMSLSDWVRPLIGIWCRMFFKALATTRVRHIILYLWRVVFLSLLEVSSCSELFVSYISCLSREMKRSRRKLFIVCIWIVSHWIDSLVARGDDCQASAKTPPPSAGSSSSRYSAFETIQIKL